MHVPAPTARLVFRAWRDDDLPVMRALFGDARVTRLIGGPFSDDHIADRLATELQRGRDLGFQYWPMFFRDGTHVGCCGVRPHPEDGVLELGYALHVAAWGQGLAVEAGRAVIDVAFGAIGVRELFAGHHPDNQASRVVLERLGFRYAGHEFYPPTGVDEPTYRLKRPENRE